MEQRTRRRNRAIWPRRNRQGGQSLVEFALVFPVFILVLAGMIDFGLGLYSYMTIINAAREGARLGTTACAVGPCTGAVAARVSATASGLAPGVTVACTTSGGGPVDCSSTAAMSGDNVKVTVNYTYHMIWPLTFGTSIPLSSSVEMVVE